MVLSLQVFSQEDAEADTTMGWKAKGALSLNLSQSSFVNWAAGGENAFSGNILFGGFVNYRAEKSLWTSTLLTTYGTMARANNFDKTDDRIEINSKYGYQAFDNKKWFLSAIMNFKTQYTAGYASDTLLVSSFMAPGYLNLGIGFDWQVADYFAVNIAPLNTKYVFVLDEYLANRGDYGVEPAIVDSLGNVITPGKKMNFKLGVYVRATFDKELFKNVNVYSSLDLFSNYLVDPQNIDVNWEVLITMKINNWLAASISTALLYDADVMFDRVNDLGEVERYGPKVQFKEVFNLGLTFNFK